ncbi:MAG: glycosyltransferase family 4 protein, partial [Clostridia bacterium]|nr:glycosyltransferase family 4 protein [Clostridia bacterium]
DENLYFRAIRKGFLDYIICVSADHGSTFFEKKSLLFIPEFGRVTFIYNPINADLIIENKSVLAKKKQILFAGALRECKGFHDALRIMCKFLRNRPDYKFIVAGDIGLHNLNEQSGYEKDFYEKMIKPIENEYSDIIRNNIEFLGKVPRNKLFHLMSESKISIQNPSWTSQAETLGMAIIEAQCLGTPAVSTFRGGQRESIINKKTGLLVKKHSDEDFLRQLNRLVEDETIYRKLSENGYTMMKDRFHYTKVARTPMCQHS